MKKSMKYEKSVEFLVNDLGAVTVTLLPALPAEIDLFQIMENPVRLRLILSDTRTLTLDVPIEMADSVCLAEQIIVAEFGVNGTAAIRETEVIRDSTASDFHV